MEMGEEAKPQSGSHSRHSPPEQGADSLLLMTPPAGTTGASMGPAELLQNGGQTIKGHGVFGAAVPKGSLPQVCGPLSWPKPKELSSSYASAEPKLLSSPRLTLK